MTPNQLREQRQSFAYGNANIENERIPREMVPRRIGRSKPIPDTLQGSRFRAIRECAPCVVRKSGRKVQG